MGNKETGFLAFVGARENVKRILVVRNGMIGDTAFVMPVFSKLRETFPDAKLDAAANQKTLSLFKNVPGIDNILPIPKDFSILKHAFFFVSLRKYHYDVAVVQESNSHYVLMARLTGAKYIAGFDNKLNRFLDYHVPWPPNVHAVLAELATVGEWTTPGVPGTASLVATENETEDAKSIMRSCGAANFDKLVCMHPGCSGKESKREWVPEYYSELSDMLIEKDGVQVVFDGVKQDRHLIEKIMSNMRNSAVSIVGKTSVRQFLGVVKLSKALVGPDTGTSHLAVAVGTPVIMLIGPSDPVDTGPFDPSGKSKGMYTEMPCIGCVRRDPKPEQWNICKDLYPVVCMNKLTPELVYKEVRAVLE